MGRRKRSYGELLDDIRQERGGKCLICEAQGYGRRKLEFAHVRPNDCVGRGRGSWKRYYSVKNNPQDYELLCKNCHTYFDNGDYVYDPSTRTFSKVDEDSPIFETVDF